MQFNDLKSMESVATFRRNSSPRWVMYVRNCWMYK